MRNPAIVATVSLFLTSCTSLVAPRPTVVPTETATPPPTLTRRPTLTPTPAGPDGATSKDAEGRWIKVEGGKTYVYMEFPLGSETYKGWFESRMKKGSINLTGRGEDVYGDIPLKLNVFFVKDFEYAHDAEYLARPSEVSDYVAYDLAYASLGSRISLDLWYLDTGWNPDTVGQLYDTAIQVDRDRWLRDLVTFTKDLRMGKSIDLGGQQWEVRKGYDVFSINETDATQDPSMFVARDLYSKLVLVDGKLVAIMAARNKGIVQGNKFLYVLLAPLEAAVKGVSENIWWMDYQKYGSAAAPGGSVNGLPITTATIELVP